MKRFKNFAPSSFGTAPPAPPPWQTCQIISDGDLFFNSLVGAINSATTGVDLEFYIFAVDPTGIRFFEVLVAAAKRGVTVRLLVDGVGSSSFARQYRSVAKECGIALRVFHELPWQRWWPRWERSPRAAAGWRTVLRRLNRRNHRKVAIIDGQCAFVGSFNITKFHLASEMGNAAWRDMAVRVEGDGISTLISAFEDTWGGPFARLRRRLIQRRKVKSPLVRLNASIRERRDSYLDLLLRLITAKQRVWITNAYFVPDGSLLRALAVIAREGVDVRIIVPSFSDVVFIPWVTSAFHFGLLTAGVKIFEYKDSVLHAKTMVIDDWGLIGSSNLNHRSLLHDLEADVVVSNREALNEMCTIFQSDLERCQEVTILTWQQRPVIERVIGRILLWFRYVL